MTRSSRSSRAASWHPGWHDFLTPQRAQAAGVTTEALAAAVAATDMEALAATTDPQALLPALLAGVDAARYWPEPALVALAQQLSRLTTPRR